MSAMKDYGYRSNVSAIIFDAHKRFLMVNKSDAPKGQLDFVKGGVKTGETETKALKREIGEEIGHNIEFSIIKKSIVRLIYNWPEDLVLKSGFIGQDRKNYWVNFKKGEIELDKKELTGFLWLEEAEMIKSLRKDRFSEKDIENLKTEWEIIKNNNNIL
jgi:NADH pyrophosphatase NudC (nudix superfamily)